MKFIKGLILTCAGLFIMITLVSLLMPSTLMTVRSVVIDADAATVFAEISDLKKWKEWHPVFMNNRGISISEPSNGKNAFATWSSNGKINKLIITAALHDCIYASLVRANENDVANVISLKPNRDSTSVEVEWRVFTKLKWYPWEKFSGIFLDKITGPGYETALDNLKNLTTQSK